MGGIVFGLTTDSQLSTPAGVQAYSRSDDGVEYFPAALPDSFYPPYHR